MIVTEQESKDHESLKKQIEELNKKLAQAQMKISGLELMIDIAEEDLNVDIGKSLIPSSQKAKAVLP